MYKFIFKYMYYVFLNVSNLIFLKDYNNSEVIEGVANSQGNSNTITLWKYTETCTQKALPF